MIIRFITLNIWQGGNLLDKAINFFKKNKPDILAMQEVYNGKNPLYERNYRTFDEVKKILDFSYATFSPAFLDTRTIGNIQRGNAIFSNFPIVSNETIMYDLPYGSFNEEKNTRYQNVPMCLQHACILIRNKILDVYNIQGIWGTDGKDSKRRFHMSEVIIAEVRKKNNVILAGDFNLNPETESIRMIEKYLRNIFKNKLTTTFNMRRKSKQVLAESVVDMIFVSKTVPVVSFESPLVDISDHVPLVCTLSF